MRIEQNSRAHSIRLLLAFCAIQLVLLASAPQCALVLLVSTLAAAGIGFTGYRRLARSTTPDVALAQSEGERSAAEQELKRQRTFLRAILDSVSSVIFVRDREQRYVMANRALAELYGTTPKLMIGRKLVELNPDKEQAQALEEADRRLLEQGGEAGPYELLIVTTSGERRWFDMVKRVIPDARGEPNLVLGIGADITERKRLQEAVQRALEVRDTILENSIVSIVFLNDQGRAVWANRAAEQMFGFERGELIGKSIERFYLSRDAYIETGGAVSKAVREGRAYEAELRMRRSDGTGLWVHLSGKAVSPADLSQGTVWVLVDITERKRAELALFDAKLRLEVALEGSNITVWENDLQTGQVRLSAGWAALLGESAGPTRIDIRDLMDMAHPEDLARAKRVAARCIKGIDSSYSVEHRVRARNGEWKWIHNRGRVIERDAGGRATRMLGTNTDITERVERERELRQSLSLLAATLESTADGILVVDREGRIASLNRNFAQIWRIPDEILAARDDDLALQHVLGQLCEPEAFSARVRELYATPDATSFDTLDFKDGRVLERYSAPQMLAGEVVGRVWSFRDVTARRNAERELERVNAELERRVAERTSQLEASVKELEAFSYTISHDLRAPLRAIDGFSKILIEEARGNLAPEARACLDRISQNARRMAELIDALLAFARYSRTALERRAIDLAALVQSVLDEQPREGREIEFHVDPLLRCNADAQLLRQVFGNLVSNAVKYSRPREVARIAIGSIERDGATVYFVRDNGVGFDMAYAHKLFGVFHRLHSEREFEGVGAGLAIVQRIVTRHGGRIWAEGELGKGATFYFTLGGSAQVAARA